MSARPWRLLLDPPGTAAWNMSVDEAVLACAADQPPTLRFYTWVEPSLSLGYRQPPPPWLERADGMGLPVVRRITGGGTVLHSGDLTYAVAAPRSSRDLPQDLRGSCEWIREVLIDGLRAAGLEARPSPPGAGAERMGLCFAGATGLEIELDRAKLVGSAQRRTRWGFLQHGSIRLADDSGLYQAILGYSPVRSPALQKLDLAGLREELCQAFERALRGKLQLASLTELELDVARNRCAARARDRMAVPRFP